jgi:hypothetical protein
MINFQSNRLSGTLRQLASYLLWFGVGVGIFLLQLFVAQASHGVWSLVVNVGWLIGLAYVVLKRRKLGIGDLAILVPYIFTTVICFPQVLFWHQVSVENYALYSRSPLPKEATESILREAQARNKTSDIYQPIPQQVFIVNNDILFKMLTFGKFGPFGVTNSLGKIYLWKADVEKNIAYRPNGQYRARSLATVISHEAVHHLAKHRDLEGDMLTANWKKEGYADFISRDSTVPESLGICLLASDMQLGDPSEWYFMYATVVKSLFAEPDMTYAKLLSNPMTEDELRSIARKYSLQRTAELGLDCKEVIYHAKRNK